MKNFYKVSNTIENGPRTDRQKSRISPINHRLWTVIAPMLFVAFGLFGVNESAWGAKISASGGGNCPNGNIVLSNDAISVTFDPNSGSFSGKDGIVGKYDLSYYWIKFGKNNTVNVNLSWSSKVAGYSVKVTNIDFDIKLEGNSEVTFDGQKYNSSGSHEYRRTNSSSSGFASGMNIQLKNTASGVGTKNREFQFSNISITYEAIPIEYSVTLENETPTTYGSTSVTLTYDSKEHATITNPKKDDHTFGGWYSEDNGEGSLVIDVNGNLQANVSGYTGADGVWRKAATTTLYAKWILNSKTITLDNQSATTAGTENITVFYNRNDNLTGTPAITVPTKTNCTFEGYYTETAGGGVQIIAKNGNVNASVAGYTDANKKWIYDGDKTLYAYWKQNQTITWDGTLADKIRSNTVTLNATASSGLTVTYSASPSDLVSISGNVVTCLKAGTVTITANQSGNGSYNASSNTPQKSFTIAEHAITQNPTATSITYEQKLSSSTLSDGTANVAGTWSWKYPNSEPVAGTANQVAVFTPSSSVISAYPIECNVSVTVAKATPDVVCTVNANPHYVDDTKIDLRSAWTREGDGVITYSVYSFAESGENNGGGTTPYVENNQYLHLQKAGTAKVVMSIAEGTNYVAHNETIDVVINKIENTLYAKGSTSYAPTMYTDKTITGVTLTAINKDYAGSPISVEQTAGNAIVSYAYNQASHSGTVSSNHKLGTATWTISQAENYKYTKAEGSFSVTVVQKDEQECYLLNEPTEHSMGKYGDSSFPTAGNASYTYSWSGRGAVLSFKMWKYSNANDIGNHVYIYDANGNKISADSKDYSISSMSTTEQEYTIDLSENARSVKFQNGGGEWATASTLNTYIKDIKVTRKTWLNVGTDNNAINGTLTINKREDGVHDVNPGQPGVKNTSVYWSCAGGGDLKIACDNGKFTFSPSTISNVACASDVTPLTVTYTSNTAGEETATVMVYNDVYYRTFTVKGVVEYADQTITWNKDVLSIDNSYTGVATANNRVTYSSADESIIRVDEDEDGYKTILTTVGTGTVEITATAAGDNFYAEKVSVKSIQVTDKLIQWIEWNQSLFNLKVGDDIVTMNAHATSNVAGCVSSRLIEYTSSDESVVKVVNSNQLQIMGVGTAVVTATQVGGIDADGHDYEAASTVKTVVVHDPNAPCESFVYQQAEEVRFDLGWNALDKQTRSKEINFNGKSPAACTFKYKGEHKTVWPVNYYDGTMYVEEYYEGSWHSVENGNLGQPTESSYKTASMTLNKKSTKMRIVASNGLGYHYFTDCQVEQARFIETTAPVAFVANVGQTVKQEIYLSYSNITDDITLSMGVSENPHFSVDVTRISGSCGDYAKNVKLTISYNSNVEESNVQDVLTITDGKTKCEVVLTGSTSRVSQTINWDHADVTNVYTVHTETLSAESRTALDVEASNVLFSFANNSTATGSISNTNELSFTSAGVAYIVAYTEESNLYYPASNIVKQWNVALTPTEVVTAPTIGNVVSGTALSNITVSGGTAQNTINQGSVSGTFTVQNGNVTDVGPNKPVTVKFTPEDETMYDVCTYNMYIEVTQRPATDEEIGTVTAGHITFGEKLSDAVLSMSGTLNGHGTLVMTDPQKDEVKDVDTYENLKVLFTPDNTNIAPRELTVSVTVDKADPVAAANAVEINYGTLASNVTLSGTGVEGTWNWTDTRKDDILAVGSYTMDVHFVPTDATNYNEKDATVALTVKKADPVAAANAVEITYGTLASSVTLSGTGVAGTWSWTDTRKDDILAAGSYMMTVHFVPTDAANYNEKDATVALTVKKATTTLSWTSNPTDLAYNATDAVYTATSASDGAITYSIISGGSYAHIDANTGALTIDLPGNTITVQAAQAEGTNYSAPTTITVEVTIAAAPVGPNTFTGNGEWENPSNWSTGIVPTTAEPDIIVVGQLVINEEKTVGGLTIMPTGGVTIVDDGKLTVNGITTTQTGGYGDIHVKDDGALALGNSADLQVRDFMLDASLGNSSNAGTSGQVSGDSKLHVNGDAYFQMSFDVSGQITYGWYDFVVPFEVDALNGVLDANGVQIVYGTDYIIMNHSEEKRARNQKAWNTFTGTLEPGRIYTITFEETKTWNTFLFKKKAGSDLVNSATYTSDYSSTIGETQDRGWNGFGNGTLQHRELTNLTGISKVQMYNHTENRYDAIDNWNEKALAVGTAFSIQVAGSQSIVLETADANKPLRAQASMRTIDEFRLTLTAEGADYSSDRMWVSASDEATGEYVIGHDLLKMGTPTQAKVAQMWAINNNLLLCDIEMPMANDMAQCMLGLFAPNAGQYILAIDAAPEDATLYLTYNGEVIWDLTASPYVFDLTKGTTTGYALRIVAANAPQITTGVEDVQGDGAQVRKVIIDNKMYIITPEGAIFDAIGKKVQ